MKILNIAALGLASALALLPAPAVARDAAPVVRISTADLNLATEAGLRTLDRRLAQAVREVCSDRAADTQLARQLSVKRCIAETSKDLAAQRARVLARRTAPLVVASATH